MPKAPPKKKKKKRKAGWRKNAAQALVSKKIQDQRMEEVIMATPMPEGPVAPVEPEQRTPAPDASEQEPTPYKHPPGPQTVRKDRDHGFYDPDKNWPM